jgi:hypothetical protein
MRNNHAYSFMIGSNPSIFAIVDKYSARAGEHCVEEAEDIREKQETETVCEPEKEESLGTQTSPIDLPAMHPPPLLPSSGGDNLNRVVHTLELLQKKMEEGFNKVHVKLLLLDGRVRVLEEQQRYSFKGF